MYKKAFLGAICCIFSILSLSAQETVRLASYNIRVCSNKTYDSQKVPDYDAIAKIIKAVDADVIGLQEVDSCARRTLYGDQFKILADLTGMDYFYGSFLDMPTHGSYGSGLLFKKHMTPEKSWKQVIKYERIKKKAVVNVLEFNSFVMVCTHLNTNAEMRAYQISVVNKMFDSYKKPVFIVGDFNAEPQSDHIKEIKTKWDIISPLDFTFPSNKPIKCIDYICLKKGSKNVQVDKAKVVTFVEGADVGVDSDHLPIFVDVTIE